MVPDCCERAKVLTNAGERLPYQDSEYHWVQMFICTDNYKLLVCFHFTADLTGTEGRSLMETSFFNHDF